MNSEVTPEKWWERKTILSFWDGISSGAMLNFWWVHLIVIAGNHGHFVNASFLSILSHKLGENDKLAISKSTQVSTRALEILFGPN